jgi:spermidine/putrescine transport system permease protein
MLVPLALVAVYAFGLDENRFSLQAFQTLLATKETRTSLLEIFTFSILYAAIATVICLLLSYPLAYFMARSKASTQRNFMCLIMVPMLMNFLICTNAWILILSKNGVINNLPVWFGLPRWNLQIINTPGAVILGMVYNYLPYMALPIYTVMAKIDPSLPEAAQDLGAKGAVTLRKIILPLTMPGVISGITMVFVPCVSTFYISQKLGGSKRLLIGDLIEMQFLTSYDYHTGAALSLILMGIIILCMLVMNRLGDSAEGSYVV